MNQVQRSVRYGDENVPVYVRDWNVAPRMPYRKTYSLQPGQHWSEAAETPNQFENYVLSEAGPVPVGSMIAREFLAAGAEEAYFTEMWHGLVLMSCDLVCVPVSGRAATFITAMNRELGRLRGLPDVLAFFSDGRISLREAKNAAAKDKLQQGQHEFARAARRVFGARVDFGVVEWGHVARPNKSLQPTATAVMPPACAGVTPSVAVAEH